MLSPSLSINAGGVGLDFPEATLMVDTTNKYAPYETEQAYARILRVGNEGEKKIVTLYYGTYFEGHQRCVTESKKAWTELLLGKSDATEENIQTFCHVLYYACLHKLLNTKKTLTGAEQEIAKNVKPNIEKIKENRGISKKVAFRISAVPESIAPTPLREVIETQNLCYVYAGLHALLNSPYFNAMLGSDLKEDLVDERFKDKQEVAKALKSAAVAHATGHEKRVHFSLLRSSIVERRIHPDLVEKFRQQDAAAFIEAVLSIYPYSGQERTCLRRAGDSTPSISEKVPFKTLQLPIMLGKDLQELVKEAFSYSPIEKDTLTQTTAQHKRTLTDLPDSIVIQLKRFDNWGVKNTRAVEMNKAHLIDLSSALDKSTGKRLYQLKSFVKHLGDELESGHYVSYLLEEGQWYEYNDIKKTPVAHENLPVKDAYVYVFDKYEAPPPPPQQKRLLEEAPVEQLAKKVCFYEVPEQQFVVIPTPKDMPIREKRALCQLLLSENKEVKELFRRARQLGVSKPDIRGKIRENLLEKGELKQTLDRLYALAKQAKGGKSHQELVYKFDAEKKCYRTDTLSEPGKPKVRLYVSSRKSRDGKLYSHYDLLFRVRY